jgi:hypothetical protein
MHEGRATVFFSMGGNFLSATPDTEYTAEALRRCSLTVQVSTKLNRAHLVTGREALILPCLGRTEVDEQAGGKQFVTMENSMGIVHASQGTFTPASEQLLSEPAIVARLAEATLDGRSNTDWAGLVGDYDRIRALIAAVVPGFDDYNRRVREPGGFYLPNAAREGRFNVDGGRARFTVHPIPRHGLREGELMMATIRSHDQYNTTIYGLDDPSRSTTCGWRPEPRRCIWSWHRRQRSGAGVSRRTASTGAPSSSSTRSSSSTNSLTTSSAAPTTRRSSASPRASSTTPSPWAPRTSTSSPARTGRRCATASTACCSTSPRCRAR